MPAPARSTPSGDEEVQPLELCKEDRRKLYGLLDAEVPRRIARMELALAVLVPSNAALLWKVFGSPGPAEVGAAFISLFT